MTEVTAYHNPNAPVHRRWIAYVVMDNGNLWGVYSTSDTEESARIKIANLWEIERARPLGLISRLRDHKPEVFSPSPSQPTGWPSELTGEAPMPSGKGQYAVGSKWVISAKGERARVSAEKAAELVASGWRYGKT